NCARPAGGLVRLKIDSNAREGRRSIVGQAATEAVATGTSRSAVAALRQAAVATLGTRAACTTLASARDAAVAAFSTRASAGLIPQEGAGASRCPAILRPEDDRPPGIVEHPAA